MGTRFFEIMTQKNERWVGHQSEQWMHKVKEHPGVKESRSPFITISREYGCAGFPLGELLAVEFNKSNEDSLPWAVYDKRLLEKIENDHGIKQALLKSLCDKTHNEITDFFSSFITSTPSQSLFYKKIFTTIRALAYQGHTIIIGRGGVVASQKISGGFHVRIYAPFDWKVKQIMTMHSISEKEAQVMLKKVTKEREGYIKKYFKAEINDPNLYHLMINNAEFPHEEMSEIILCGLKKKGIYR